jgi:hypothetical protein
MMRDQVRERDNLKWLQHGDTKLPNAGTATFTRDTGMVDFTENPNACPLSRLGLEILKSVSPNESCVRSNCAIQSKRSRNTSLSSFPPQRCWLISLLLPISGFVLNISWLVTDTLNHFEFLLASHFLCLPQEVNKLQAHNEKPLDTDSSNQCLAEVVTLLWMVMIL